MKRCQDKMRSEQPSMTVIYSIDLSYTFMQLDPIDTRVIGVLNNKNKVGVEYDKNKQQLFQRSFEIH